MTVSTQQTTRPGVVTRCAVCKVDLRGRFVFVDDRTEQILGYPREELFGKPFTDFLDQTSQELVRDLLNRRNHYETFYDAVNVALVTADGTPLEASAIVCLNFNAGNPVNFQWIINPDRVSTASAEPPADAARYRQLAEYLAEVNIAADWRGFLTQLRSFTGARQACAYIISGDKLEHRSSAVEGDDASLSFARVAEPGEIHRDVARTGRRYDFTDQEAVRKAIEKDNTAPNEIVGCLAFDEDTRYLVRLIFETELEDLEAEACADRSRFALDLAQLLIAPPRTQGEELDDENLKFSVGLLDGLGIGCMSTDSRGRISVYNPTLARLLEAEELDGDLSDFALLLHRGDGDGAAQSVLDYLQPSTHACEFPPPPLDVFLPDQRCARIHYLALTDTPDDLSAFVAVIPSGSRADLAGRSCTFWAAVTDSIRSGLRTAGTRIESLKEAGKKKLGEEGLEAMQAVGATITDTAGQLDHLNAVALAQSAGEPIGRVDLTLVVNEAVSAVTRRFPHIKFMCDFRTLGKIQSRRGCLKTAIENLLAAIVRASSSNKVEVAVTAESGELDYSLTFAWSLIGEAVKRKDGDTEDKTPEPALPDHESSIEYIAAALLIESLGGRLETSANAAGAQAVCRLPNS